NIANMLPKPGLLNVAKAARSTSRNRVRKSTCRVPGSRETAGLTCCIMASLSSAAHRRTARFGVAGNGVQRMPVLIAMCVFCSIGTARRAAHVELEDTRNHDDRLRPLAGLLHGEADRVAAVDEQPPAPATLILDDPMAAAVTADQEKIARASFRRFRFGRALGHVSPLCVTCVMCVTFGCEAHR